MGYLEATIVDAQFAIPATRMPDAVRVAADFLADLGYDGPSDDLGTLFRLFELALETGDDGAVTGLAFDGRLLEELEVLFRTVAPYVAPGSVIHWRGGTGVEWWYRFDGERLITEPN